MSVPAGSRESGVRRPRVWIESPALDLSLLTLSPLIGLAAVATQLATGTIWAAVAVAYLVGFPHYLSTLTFYMGDENREAYKKRWLAYFVGPLFILGGVLGLRLAGLEGPVLATIFVWNIYHVALQSSGILNIYRRLNGGPDSERRVAKGAILATNSAMAFWNIEAFPPLADPISAAAPFLFGLLPALSAAAAIFFLARLALALARRAATLSLPEASFLITSLLLFHPFLWVEDLELATLAMLAGHFFQYVALVWLLHRRKYGAAAGTAAQRILGYLGSRPALLVATLLAAGLGVYAFTRVSTWLGMDTARRVIFNALVLNHFYLDGLFWAFRDPHVRRSLGPYLQAGMTPSERKLEWKTAKP